MQISFKRFPDPSELHERQLGCGRRGHGEAIVADKLVMPRAGHQWLSGSWAQNPNGGRYVLEVARRHQVIVRQNGP